MRNPALALSLSLLACIPRSASADPGPTARSGPYSLEVVGEDGSPLPAFRARGRVYVLGELGKRYTLRVRNDSGRRIEVVASVDGRDVVDGRPASLEKRGYRVDAHGELTIEGFRLSQEAVAAFRFSSVGRSYAARMGDAQDVGVIGLAVFPERERRRPAAARPPWPERLEELGAAGQGRDAQPGSEASAEAKAAPAPGAAARAERRPGLGTEFGEEHDSHVDVVAFERARAEPDALLTVRYDDRAGLVALGIDVDRRLARRDDAWLRDRAQPFRATPGYSQPPPGWRP
jgi:hypothetical protein